MSPGRFPTQGRVMMTLAVVWFVPDGGGASRRVQSEEAEQNAGCNPDTVKRSTEVSKDLRRLHWGTQVKEQ